ncbi:olfactory receptor 5V1-like, partial [Python bivittatus]|uniref:Olfactory receptor n=1 Tax=Python bivittatus TaxID=176946 RepID=A0A9F2RDQ1_PYTBI
MVNQTRITKFILLGFSDIRELQYLYFAVLFPIYVIALTGNLLVITAVVQNPKLHNPMYFFLVNLSLVDACYISTTVPKSLDHSLRNYKEISFWGCVTQVALVVTLVTAEVIFLTAMAYDRYVAICYPLQYQLIMNWNTCFQMAAAVWIASIICALIQTTQTFKLDFCQSNIIKQYFCDIPQLLSISCTNTIMNKKLLCGLTVIIGSFCILSVFIPYGLILSAVFKMQSIRSRQKAISTCIPHLTVFSLFALTALFSYFRPRALSSPLTDLLTGLLYTVLPPLMNPIIYTLRNKDIQLTLSKLSK